MTDELLLILALPLGFLTLVVVHTSFQRTPSAAALLRQRPTPRRRAAPLPELVIDVEEADAPPAPSPVVAGELVDDHVLAEDRVTLVFLRASA